MLPRDNRSVNLDSLQHHVHNTGPGPRGSERPVNPSHVVGDVSEAIRDPAARSHGDHLPADPDALVDYVIAHYALVNAELLVQEHGVEALRWATSRMELAANRDRVHIDTRGNEHLLSMVRNPAGLIVYLCRQYHRVRRGGR